MTVRSSLRITHSANIHIRVIGKDISRCFSMYRSKRPVIAPTILPVAMLVKYTLQNALHSACLLAVDFSADFDVLLLKPTFNSYVVTLLPVEHRFTVDVVRSKNKNKFFMFIVYLFIAQGFFL